MKFREGVKVWGFNQQKVSGEVKEERKSDFFSLNKQLTS